MDDKRKEILIEKIEEIKKSNILTNKSYIEKKEKFVYLKIFNDEQGEYEDKIFIKLENNANIKK